jgi:hypothetical protein
VAVATEHKVAAQWLRLSFHDAGTFNKNSRVGGANGCLMNDLRMRDEPENGHLDVATDTLQTIRDNWENLKSSCIDISSADIIQFAGLFAAVRQTGVPGITAAKTKPLLKFKWGRPDEKECQTDWTHNLPGFAFGEDDNLPLRCKLAGKEIKNKMMDKNGFTSEEATALIGAHTIGLTRNVFGPFAAPWVESGADSFTANGPIFDNAFFDFLENKIIANTTTAFGANTAPFTSLFPTWVQTDPPTPLNYIDTDLVLAFPPANAADHPDYHAHTAAFSRSKKYFLDTFYKALRKMGKLGVFTVLSAPSACTSCEVVVQPVTGAVVEKVSVDVAFVVAAAEDTIAAAQEENKEEIAATTTVSHEFILVNNGTKTVEITSTP